MSKSLFWYPAESQRYMWAFLIGGFLQVSYEPHDWSHSYLWVTVERWLDMSKFTEGSWQRAFTVNSKRAVWIWKPSSWTKMLWGNSFNRPESVGKFADCFLGVFQSLKMHGLVFCNLAESSGVKTNQKLHGIQWQKKYTHNSGPGISDRKLKKLRLFSRNKSSRLYRGKRKPVEW